VEKLEGYIKNYLVHCQKRKKLDWKTIKAYRIDLWQFRDFLELHAYDFDKSGLEEYMTFLHGTYKGRSVKRKLATIKAFCNYLENEEAGAVTSLRLIKTKFREERVLPKSLTFQTVKLIWDAVYEGQFASRERRLRDIAVFELLFATGLRVSELCSLKYKDIDLENGQIKIRGKGAKERLVQVCNPEALLRLSEYKDAFSTQILMSGYFFVNRLSKRLSEQSVRYMIRGYAKIAGINQSVTPHMFRHTFATMLLEEDVDIRYIQKMLGHSSINTTEIYTHVAMQKQKEILVSKHPRNKLNYSVIGAPNG
jgi:integrase/recombinase XerD